MTRSRYKDGSSPQLSPPTVGQLALQARFKDLMTQQKDVPSLSGGIASGEMVRLLKCKPGIEGVRSDKVGDGNGEILTCWHKGTLDLVSGHPTNAMGVAERVLQRVADPDVMVSKADLTRGI
jgi:hypothetical protein